MITQSELNKALTQWTVLDKGHGWYLVRAWDAGYGCHMYNIWVRRDGHRWPWQEPVWCDDVIYGGWTKSYETARRIANNHFVK